MQYIVMIHKHKYPSEITKLNQIKRVKKYHDSFLPWFSSGSTTNLTTGSSSTVSVGSIGSLSGVSVTIMHEWIHMLA
jgi:hypothetical protein